jgi:hypothetical protein
MERNPFASTPVADARKITPAASAPRKEKSFFIKREKQE